MKVFSATTNLCIWVSVDEAELILAGYRALYQNLTNEKVLTPAVSDQIITAIMHIEMGLLNRANIPELKFTI